MPDSSPKAGDVIYSAITGGEYALVRTGGSAPDTAKFQAINLAKGDYRLWAEPKTIPEIVGEIESGKIKLCATDRPVTITFPAE